MEKSTVDFAEINAKLCFAQKELAVAKTLIALSMMTDMSIVHDAYFSNMLGFAQVQRRYLIRLLPLYNDDDLDWLFANVIETIDAVQQRRVDILDETIATQADFLNDLLNDQSFTESDRKTLLLIHDAHTMLQRYLSFFHFKA